jgi:hypothetical protein
MMLKALSDFISAISTRFQSPPEIDWEGKAEIDRQRVVNATIRLPIASRRKSLYECS